MSVLASKRLEKLTYQIQVGSFEMISDVSEALGGDNRGPNPHEYLEAALAGCTAITLQMYAARKSMALESVDVKIRITAEGASNEILREIRLTGALSTEERASLMKIADKCPIHKFLSAGAKISTTELA